MNHHLVPKSVAFIYFKYQGQCKKSPEKKVQESQLDRERQSSQNKLDRKMLGIIIRKQSKGLSGITEKANQVKISCSQTDCCNDLSDIMRVSK